MARRVWIVFVVVLAAVGQALAQQDRIDAITPMAPERAAYGSMPVGVRTITVTDHDRADVLNTKAGGSVTRRRSWISSHAEATASTRSNATGARSPTTRTGRGSSRAPRRA